MSKSIIQEKSFQFSIDIVNTYKELVQNKKEFILSKQLLRSGTSIGANVSEATHGQSSKDFISKLSIARKEANETLYWINLMKATDILEYDNSNQLISKCDELLRILTSIIKTMQTKQTIN